MKILRLRIIDILVTGKTMLHWTYHILISLITNNKILSNNPTKLKLVCTFTNKPLTLDWKLTIVSGGCDIVH